MTELANIDICRMLHEVRYFGNIRVLQVGRDVLESDDPGREDNRIRPKINQPRLHEVSDWIRRKLKMEIRIELHMIPDLPRPRKHYWKYLIYYDKRKSVIIGSNKYNDYGAALEGAITNALKHNLE